jgi:nucleotide-binding universal stress UspA family protein
VLKRFRAKQEKRVKTKDWSPRFWSKLNRKGARPIVNTEVQMFNSILVPLDLADTDLAKPAIATAATLSQTWHGTVRLLNVLPMTPVMLAEYVPADFDAQHQTSEEALAIVARESGIDAHRISTVVRQGGIYHEILEEAALIKADLIVMTSHRPAMRTYFLGSNAGHVVRYAKCSVLVVRH